jgi:murein DD-endopeptidase MepM/ murein hydrolase activator NlpD
MKRRILSLYLLITAIGSLWGDYPHIQSLKPSDILFRQMQSDIAAHYRALSYGKNGVFPPLAFFSYTRHPDDTIFTLAARLNLPYETIATLNGLSQAGEFAALQEIIIPNSPGIFLPENPANSLEEIMAAWRASSERPGERVVVRRNGREQSYIFFRGERFHPVERGYFLKIIFLLPLKHAVITSSFGPRADPFTGHPSFHNGIDLAAPVGSLVQATQDGLVKETGRNEILGKFIRVAHTGGYETLYGHLKSIFVSSGDKVKAGHPLGTVGMTGKTTGPHLHFELRRNGQRINPESMLP